MSDNANNQGFTVSVVIPAYNASEHISRAIDSVLAQTCKPEEIIVVDDGSTDDTAEKIGEYESSVTYIRQENAGASSARNTGIQAASSEWIAFLDGDDEWLPEKLQLQVDLLKRNPDLCWVSGNYEHCLCDEDRCAVIHEFAKVEGLLDGGDHFDYLKSQSLGVWGHTSTTIVRKDTLQTVGLFKPGMHNFEDMDMWWRIAIENPIIGYCSRALAIHHLGSTESLSQRHKPLSLFSEVIGSNLALAKEHGKTKQFEPCVEFVIRQWFRGMLFDERAKDIRSLIGKFGYLLPSWYRGFMFLLTSFPKTTARGCHLISKVIRTFHLRRKVVRRPK